MGNASSVGGNLGYTIGSPIPLSHKPDVAIQWEFFNGQNKKTNQEVSIFKFAKEKNANNLAQAQEFSENHLVCVTFF